MKTLFLSLLILARGLGAGAVPPQPTGLSSTASCQAWAPSESQSAAARGLSPAAGALSGTAAADLTPFLDRPWRSFLYGIFGLDKCFAKSGEPAELLFRSGGAYSLTIGSPDDGAAFALHRGNFGRSGAAWQMGEPGGAFTVRPYASMSAAEVQAALDRIWGAEQCGLGGDGSANWYFAKVDGKATKLKAVHNRAEADEQLKAQLARWNPLYFSSQLYAGFLLPAERVGVLK